MSGPDDPTEPPPRSADAGGDEHAEAGSSAPDETAARYSDDTRPLPPVEPETGQPPHTYAVQELTEQHVDRPHRHTGLYAAIAVAVVAVIVAAVVFLVNRDGHGDRTAYCDKLRSVTGNGDLVGAVGTADPSDLDTLAKLAPDAVSGPWADLVQLRDEIKGGGSLKDVNVAQIGDDVATIVSDARSGCSITLNVPVGGTFSTS